MITSTPLETDAAKRKRFLFVLVLLFLVAATYSAAPLGDFVWDDRVLIVEQERELRSTSFVDFFLQPFFPKGGDQSARNFYRPLVKASFAADLGVWDLSPAGFHLTNLALHLAVTLLLFLLLVRRTARSETAFFLAAAFGVAPRLTEAVAWISGRTDLLATLFCLLALLATLTPSSRPTGRRWFAAFLVMLGLLSKESAIAGAVAIAVHEWRRGGQLRFPARLVRLTPVAATLAAYALLRMLAMSGVRTIGEIPLTALERVFGIAEAVGRYSMMIAIPWLPETQIGSAGDPVWPYVGLGALGVILLGIAGVRLSTARERWNRWKDEDLMGLVLLLVPLCLVTLIPLPLNVVAADRFLYLPLAGLALLAAGVLERLRLSTRAAAAVAVPVIASLAWVTFGRIEVWRTNLSLWEPEAAGAVTAYPLLQLAEAQTRGGDPTAALPLLDRAEALAVSADQRHGWSSIQSVRVIQGLTLFALERYPEAETIYRGLAARYPDRPHHLHNLAVCLVLQLRFEDALATLDNHPTVDVDGTRALRKRIIRLGESIPNADPANSDVPALRRELLSRLAEPID